MKTTRRKPRLSSKKKPRQERSRATVEAILEAATDILIRHGHAKLTTNRIAERAGVNIASLYQYFPGKEAIVAELRQRHLAESADAARKVLAEHRHGTVETAIRALVSIGIAIHGAAPKLHEAFSEVLPARRARLAVQDDAVVAEIKHMLDVATVGVPDKDLALWVVDTAGYAVIHRAAIEQPEALKSGALANELSTLLLGYLQRK